MPLLEPRAGAQASVMKRMTVIARFPPVSPISIKIGEVHRKANFSETQIFFYFSLTTPSPKESEEAKVLFK
jgi:hypothetical protein